MIIIRQTSPLYAILPPKWHLLQIAKKFWLLSESRSNLALPLWVPVPVCHFQRRYHVCHQDYELNHNTGIGLTAKSAEAGGISLIIIYNSGRFRMNGRGSLAGLMPYSNANDVVVEMASDVLPVVKHTPVIAGVCASDPGRDMGRFLRQLKDLGFAGVQNFPTVGLIDGNFRQNLEETGMGYDTEVEMVRIAHEMDLVTTPYVFNPEEAKLMAEAGADVIVAHSKSNLPRLLCPAC